jgi:hypothetical protein
LYRATQYCRITSMYISQQTFLTTKQCSHSLLHSSVHLCTSFVLYCICDVHTCCLLHHTAHTTTHSCTHWEFEQRSVILFCSVLYCIFCVLLCLFIVF